MDGCLRNSYFALEIIYSHQYIAVIEIFSRTIP
jgi:hypothetical protein